MSHMRKESHIVSKSGVEYRWMCLIIPVKAEVHTIVIYVRDAEPAIAVQQSWMGLVYKALKGMPLQSQTMSPARKTFLTDIPVVPEYMKCFLPS